jgi:hypothetical protein
LSCYSNVKARRGKGGCGEAAKETGCRPLILGRSMTSVARSAPAWGKLGVSHFIIARVLNHADRTVTEIYETWCLTPITT